MVAVTYGRDVASPAAVAAPTRKGFFARLMQAVMDARMQAAERQIRLHRHLLPAELELKGDKLTRRNEEELPFGGW